MVALKKLTEEEAALAALLMDDTGVDLMEFAGVDESKSDRCMRLRPYQWKWYVDESKYSVCASARDVGKTWIIVWQALAHVHASAGTDFFLTAPGGDHLKPVYDKIEEELLRIRLLTVMLRANFGKTGISKIPSFEARFRNSAKIITRLPKQDGRGVKGQHSKKVIVDECLPAGTLVITKRGFVPIEDIVPGDTVWTHLKRWRAVTATATKYRPTVLIKGKGHYGMVASEHHPFFASSWVNAIDAEGHPLTVLGRPGWIRAAEMEGAHWSACTGVGGRQDVPFESTGFARGPKRGRLYGFQARSAEAAWVLGHWVAEGSCAASGSSNGGRLDRIYFSIAAHERSEVVLRHKLARLEPSGITDLSKHGGAALNVVYTGAEYVEFAEWLQAEFGRGALNKRVPLWVIAEKREFREQFLEGLLYGDGHDVPDIESLPARRLTTASRELAITCGVLARSLGYQVAMHRGDHSKYDKSIRGRKIKGGVYYTVQITAGGRDINFDGYLLSLVREVTPTGKEEVLYDLTVEEDHSFTADGLYCHNSQDYPELAWDQLYPTLRSDLEGSQMKLYGVTVGTNSTFDKHATDPESVFRLIRKTAPERPTWNDEERKAAIKKYGSETSIRYSQNIFGVSSGVYSDLFVTARLMACVQIEQSPWAKLYNRNVYQHIDIDDDRLRGSGRKPVEMMSLPAYHLEKQYDSYWAGWDIGFTRDASEMMVFGAFKQPKHDLYSYRLLTRVSMKGISTPDQIEVMGWLLDFYGDRFVRLGLDGTGAGLPIAQVIDATRFRDKVRGYGFSEKLVVGWEDRKLGYKEKLKDIEIKMKTPDHGLDQLRKLVDSGRWELPMDIDLLSQLQGIGEDHALHSCYLFGVARAQYDIERKAETMKEFSPISPLFGF